MQVTKNDFMTCEEVLKGTNYGNSTDKIQVHFQKVF